MIKWRQKEEMKLNNFRFRKSWNNKLILQQQHLIPRHKDDNEEHLYIWRDVPFNTKLISPFQVRK